MRRHGLAVPLLLIAIAASGCTDSTEPAGTSPTSNPLSAEPTAGESSVSVGPSSSSETDGRGTALTQAEAQAALDDALAAVDKEGSIGFTSRGQNVIDHGVTTISSSGAWTRTPLAWTTTITYDRPKSTQADPLQYYKSVELIYVNSAARSPYVRLTFAPAEISPWLPLSGYAGALLPVYAAGGGTSKKDVTTPPAFRLLTRTEASAGSSLGDTLTISGTIPSSTALDVLELTDHLGGLGFANRFEDSTTRVLVTIGADGLPQTLEFAGTNISLPGVGLPDYVAEELAGARYFVEYGDAKLKAPIKVPVKAFTP